MRIIRASCNWERSLSSDLSFFDDTDPGLFNEARIFFFGQARIRRDMWSVSVVCAPPRQSPPYPLHRPAAPVAGSRWLRKMRAGRWDRAASRTNALALAARRPAAADTRHSGINRASERADIPVRRECLRLLKPSSSSQPAHLQTPLAQSERYRRNVRCVCSADLASAA